MVLIEFGNKEDKSVVTKWSKRLYKENYEPLPFKFPALTPPEPISCMSRVLNYIIWKWDEIKDGLRIIFKGEYPDY